MMDNQEDPQKPWYSTIWAYILYFVGLIVIYYFFKFHM